MPQHLEVPRSAGATVGSDLGGGLVPLVRSKALPPDDAAVGAVVAWLESYLGSSDPRLGRPGAICPSVQPALRSGAVRIRIVTLEAGDIARQVRDTVSEIIDNFEHYAHDGTPSPLDCVIVVFPELDGGQARLLDDVHRDLKDTVVGRGLMFAQFFPGCDVRSVRNKDVPVASAPLPMMAFRRLAIHDVIFLSESRLWSEAYVRAFGDRLPIGTSRDRFVTDAHARARALLTERRATARDDRSADRGRGRHEP